MKTAAISLICFIAGLCILGIFQAREPSENPREPIAVAATPDDASPESARSVEPAAARPIPVRTTPRVTRGQSLAQVFGTKPLTSYIPGDRLTLRISPDRELPLLITGAETLDPSTGGHSLAARIEGIPFGRVSISTLGNALFASVNGAELGNFEIRRAADSDQLEIKRLTPIDDLQCTTDDPTSLSEADSDGVALDPTRNSASPRAQLAALTGGTIDVAIFFNDQARVILGGAPGNPADDADIRVKIAAAITDANSALADSNVPTILRAVSVAAIDYPYPPGEVLDRALNEIRSPTDGAIDQVHALRNAAQADIVSLWIENDVGGGKANLNFPSNVKFQNAFNIIRAQNPTTTFVHEIGHNHGCRHLRSSYTGTPSSYFPDSFAHLLTSSGGSRFVTVVASSSDASGNGATRILRISAPELAYLGTPTGLANDTNNAATFRAVGPLIANFRGGPDTTPPTVALKTKTRIKTRRGRLTVRGTTTDDVAVDRVVYKATGVRGLKTAKGTRQWKLKIRLKKRRTVVKIFAFDTANNRSRVSKVKIIRIRR